MCGIVGILNPAGPPPEIRQRLTAMTDAVAHRGPDDAGQYLGPGIALGFRRLAIVDLVTGNQPMATADGRVRCVVNGEIFNHRALRRDLEARGHRFRTTSDIEVVPALYREVGPDFVTALNGQFAVALWDEDARRLVLARDPVGIAPLFVTRVDRQLLFASEIKALLAHPGVQRRLNPTGLDQILSYPGPVSPHTLFAGIESVPPGTVITVDRDSRERRTVYWDLDYPRADAPADPRPADVWVEELEAALLESIRLRLQADVPVGAYLSGGLDSSLIAAMMGRLEPDAGRRTYSVAFPDHAIDERRWQRLMAERIGSRHLEHEIAPADIVARLPDIVRHAEAPLRESYNACSLHLSAMVRESGLKTILTGEGADELFGGYVGYRLDATAMRSDDEPEDPLEGMLEAQARQRLWGDPAFMYEKRIAALREIKQALYAPALAAALDRFDCTAESPVDLAMLDGRSAFHRRSYLDFKLRMADHLLADHGDRVAFANGVEARYPFLDPGVIDVARRIPPALMLERGEEKAILKRLARRWLPAEIVDRRKFSFVAPASPDLLRTRANWVFDLLSPARIARDGVFDPDTVADLMDLYQEPDFAVNQTYQDDLLMIVLTYGLFADQFGLSTPA